MFSVQRVSRAARRRLSGTLVDVVAGFPAEVPDGEEDEEGSCSWS